MWNHRLLAFLGHFLSAICLEQKPFQHLSEFNNLQLKQLQFRENNGKDVDLNSGQIRLNILYGLEKNGSLKRFLSIPFTVGAERILQSNMRNLYNNGCFYAIYIFWSVWQYSDTNLEPACRDCTVKKRTWFFGSFQ